MAGNKFTFGFGSRADGAWLCLTRDLAVDLRKALSAAGKSSGRRFRRSSVRVAGLRLLGEGWVVNATTSSEEDEAMFFHAADWFLDNQVRTTIVKCGGCGPFGWIRHFCIVSPENKLEIACPFFSSVCRICQ